MPNIVLIVDDEPRITELLQQSLAGNGIESDIASNGREALDRIAAKNYSLILMDINMPEINGFEIIKRIRAEGKTTPIIIVSDRREDIDTVYGLGIGADDYITKPFNPITLGAKVKAMIRRSQGDFADNHDIIAIGPFEYNLSSLRLYKNGVEIPLTSRENAMMKLFLDNPNRVFSKDMLYEMVWDNTIVDDNTIMVYINRLRNKIEDNPAEPHYIQTVRSIGYRFVI